MSVKQITPAELASTTRLRMKLEDCAEKALEITQELERDKQRYERHNRALAIKYKLREGDEITGDGAIIRKKDKDTQE